jgi:hypothetical protein
MDSVGIVKLRTRQGPSFIFLKPVYSNNKELERQVFRVSGEWECPKSVKLTESQRISQERRALDGGLTNLPEISNAEQEEVTRMIDYCKNHHKVENDFNAIVNDKSLNDHLGYKIPENNVPLTKTGKHNTAEAKVPEALVPSRVQGEASRAKKPSSQVPSVEGIPGKILGKKTLRPATHIVPSRTSTSRENSIPSSSHSQGRNASPSLRAIVEPEVPLFQEVGGGDRDGHSRVPPISCRQFGGRTEC